MNVVEQLEKNLADVRESKKKNLSKLEKLQQQEQKFRQKLELMEKKKKELKQQLNRINKNKSNIEKVNKRKAENHRKFIYGGLIAKYAGWIDQYVLEQFLIQHKDILQQKRQSAPYDPKKEKARSENLSVAPKEVMAERRREEAPAEAKKEESPSVSSSSYYDMPKNRG